MQRLTYFVATTLDGRIARADGSFDCFVNEGDHVVDYLAALRTFDSVLMGRHTYEIGTKLGVTNPYPWLKTYVVSNTFGASPEPNVTILDAESVGVRVRELKGRDGRGIYLCGGGQLASLLLAQDLVDEVVIKLNPVLVGEGIPLVATLQRPVHLELVDTKIYESDVVVVRYRVKRR